MRSSQYARIVCAVLLSISVHGSRRFEREYIWGPGDSHAGVDELLALFEGAKPADLAAAASSVPNTGTAEEQAAARLAAQAAASLAAQSKPWWVIQDASGDVVALCDNGGPSVASNEPGAPATGGSGAGSGTAIVNTGRVVQQWTYDAYGAVLAAEQVVDDPNMVIPNLRVGHKGLFADRFDATLVHGADEPARLVPYAAVVHHVRNRAYQPSLGRWMQRDPNGTGQQVVAATAMHGENTGVMLGGYNDFSALQHFANGLNTFVYLGASPLLWNDSLGLVRTGYPPYPGGSGLGGVPNNRLVHGANGGLQFWGTINRQLSLNSQLRAQAAARQARRGQGSSTSGAAIDWAMFVGRTGGALLGAQILDGGWVGNRALARSWDNVKSDFGFTLAGSAAGLLPGGWGTAGGLGVFATQQFYNGFDLVGTGSALLTEFGKAGVSRVAGGAGTAVALAASVYSGIIDYAAESVGDWWRR